MKQAAGSAASFASYSASAFASPQTTTSQPKISIPSSAHTNTTTAIVKSEYDATIKYESSLQSPTLSSSTHSPGGGLTKLSAPSPVLPLSFQTASYFTPSSAASFAPIHYSAAPHPASWASAELFNIDDSTALPPPHYSVRTDPNGHPGAHDPNPYHDLYSVTQLHNGFHQNAYQNAFQPPLPDATTGLFLSDLTPAGMGVGVGPLTPSIASSRGTGGGQESESGAGSASSSPASAALPTCTSLPFQAALLAAPPLPETPSTLDLRHVAATLTLDSKFTATLGQDLQPVAGCGAFEATVFVANRALERQLVWLRDLPVFGRLQAADQSALVRDAWASLHIADFTFHRLRDHIPADWRLGGSGSWVGELGLLGLGRELGRRWEAVVEELRSRGCQSGEDYAALKLVLLSWEVSGLTAGGAKELCRLGLETKEAWRSWSGGALEQPLGEMRKMATDCVAFLGQKRLAGSIPSYCYHLNSVL